MLSFKTLLIATLASFALAFAPPSVNTGRTAKTALAAADERTYIMVRNDLTYHRTFEH